MCYKNNKQRFILGVLFLCVFFGLGVKGVEAAPIKILSDSRHAYGSIISTINQLMGAGHVGTDFIVHSTNMSTTGTGIFSTDVNAALSTTASYYDESGNLVTSQAPYQIFTTSATGYSGDNVTEYNLSATYDIAHNYGYSNSPAMPSTALPPIFHIAPGGSTYASSYGVEWTLDPAIFDTTSLSSHTAANASMISVLRYLHSTSTAPWNWFDTKAALRQTSANWATGYNKSTYGFGQVNYTTANALTDGQILLQPPVVATSTSGIYSQITFTVYPFKQTRRVKEVLFQFASNPGFQANELTLAQIQALGGTKITEYTGITATTSAPISAAVTNAYFVWFTADNSTDSAASFSRIDTYSVLGPLSQNESPFSGSFDLASPSNNVSTTSSPMFSWNAASSYLGISKYQLFVDGSLNKDNITGTSATPTSNLSEGAHTWYVKAFNGGGSATTTVSTPTINIVSGYITGYTFYVDNVLGNDNNPGTQALPWATLSKAGLTAVAGDTVVIIKNTNTPYRETLTPSRAGTSGLPITFRGVDANSKPEIWGSTDVSSGWSVYGGGNANTYQYATSTNVKVLAVGPSIASVTSKTKGTAATTLNPGEWFWVSSVLYYRLASGEDISTLHIEASTRNSGVTSTSYTTYQNIIVRYANMQGVSLLSSTGGIAHGVEVYDSQRGFYVGGTSNSVQYSVGARNKDYGFYLNFPLSATVYDSIFYGNTTGGGRVATLGTTGVTLKNNVFSGNGGSSVSFQVAVAPLFITASNNLWDIAGDSNWTTYKGTNNQELADPLLINPNAGNFSLQQFSPNIDAGTSVGLTTDILGNPIYGTPDIGGYEYQPPYTITSSGVPIGGAFRMYKNGKYRMTVATSSSATANMTIAPEGGFPSGDYGEYLNVAVNSWNTSGDYTKSWTESSSAATSTAHTIGDLAPNGFYAVSVDGTKYATFRADAGGQGTFTYSGGYSTHTFSIAQDFSVTNGPPSLIGTVTGSVVVPSLSPADSMLTISAILSTTTSTVATSTFLIITKSISPAFTRTLKKGLRGVDVSALQKILKKDSIIYPEGLVTGYFGTLTENAIKRFQKKHSIVSSGTPGTTGYGLVGPKTRSKLNALIGK